MISHRYASHFFKVSFVAFLLMTALVGQVFASNSVGDRGQNYVPGELLIKYKAGVSARAAPSLESTYGLTLVKKFKNPRGLIGARAASVGLDRWQHVRARGNVDLRALRDRIAREPSVEYVEFNYIVHANATPNDPRYSELWGMHNTGQTGGTIDADIDAPEAWDIHTGDGSIIVGVIDTGVYHTHPDLAANMWVNAGEIPGNNIDDDNNGYVDDVHGYDFVNNDGDPMDDQGHGTHCAGTIAAVGDNGVGVVGVSWKAQIMGLKFLDAAGSGSTANAVSAVIYATDNGAHMTSNSWGGGGFSQALADAIEAANTAGQLFIAAAGNSNSDNDASPHYPSNYDSENIISVAAIDHNNARASFSNWGATSVDLGAPGVNILSTVPDYTADISDPSGYAAISGTSMATPHVAGAAALLSSNYPDLGHIEIKALILSSAMPASSMDGITVTGGVLNVAAAMEDDIVPPAAVSDLASGSVGARSADLTWSATGDDGSEGTASLYELRYSTATITEANFATATLAAMLPVSGPQGTAESATVIGLEPETEYFFALKVIDNLNNRSTISNVASATTAAEVVVFYDPMNSVDNWTIAGTAGPDGPLWHLTDHRYDSASSAFYYGVDATKTYDTGAANNGTITSAAISLVGFSSPLLSFSHFLETENFAPYDRASVSVSSDNGTSWTEVYGSSLGTDGAMVKHYIDLSAYAGEVIQLRFGFDTGDSISNAHEGWVVDDVQVAASGGSVNLPPVAAFSVSDNSVDVGEPVSFDGSASSDPEGSALTYSWDFGDGTVVSGDNATPTHTYTAAGTYTVSLVVNDGALSSVAATQTVEASLPVADPGGPYSAGVGETITFDGSGSSAVSTYNWDFGDGTTVSGSDATPQHSYAAAGSYTVTLVVTNGFEPSAPVTTTATISDGTTYEDNFNGYEPGSNPDNWLDTGARNSLGEDDSLFQVMSVGGESAFGTSSSQTNIHSHFSGSSLNGLSGYEITGRMMVSNANGGIGITFFSQYPNADEYYRLRRYASQPTFRISPHGTSVSGDTDSGVNPVANAWYMYKVEVEDTGTRTEIRAKVWLQGSAEPSEWQINAFDQSASRLTSGTIGTWAMGAGSKYWDDFNVVSLGEPPVQVEVPNVVGIAQANAEALIIDAGLVVGSVTTEHSDTVTAGSVISSNPAAGVLVDEGGAVDLVVSLGPVVMVDVPSLQGLSQSDAEAELLSVGLVVGTVTGEYSDSVAAGVVISQTPDAGTSVPEASSVDLVVSLGPPPAAYMMYNFEGQTPGSHPLEWMSTGAGNSLSFDESRFDVADLAGNAVFRGGFAAGNNTNIHSHYDGTLSDLSSYEYTGRMMTDNNNGGVGVTFFSDYPLADHYYRLRRWSGNKAFHLNAHGTSLSGDTTSGVTAVPNQWYQYRIQVVDTGTRTEIKARVWADGSAEPSEWQIDAYDASGSRATSGTVGVWSMPAGVSYWDDFMVAPIP